MVKDLSAPFHEHKRGSSIGLVTRPNVDTSNEVGGREAEKLEAQARQRELYMNENNRTNSGFGNFDPHFEHLLYLFTIEMFILFITYSHYTHLDEWNKFLTPIFIGGETSLVGQTITQLLKWFKNGKNNIRDEEYYAGGASKGIDNDSTLDVEFEELKSQSFMNHLKFLAWGSLNGLLCSYWIQFLIETFDENRLMCVLIDQTIGTIIFQSLYTLFVCIWDVEIEVVATSTTIDLTVDNFLAYYPTMLWKYMKLSYLVWPLVSYLSFTQLSPDAIFPLNCIWATIFSIILGL